MTDVTTSLPPALSRALDLLAEPPADPDVSNGYLNLLENRPGDVAENTGAIQKVWASNLGSFFYDNAQMLARRLFSAWQPPVDWLNIPQGGNALDVGSGPGNVTASLGRAVGPAGLAVGIDISEPMLKRAVRAESAPNVGFLRADAQRLPFRDDTFDAVVSIAVFQLIPDPAVAIGEMARVLRPGGRIALMVPTAAGDGPLWRLLPNSGAHFFGDDDLGDIFEDVGFTSVRVKNYGPIQWVRGKR